MTVKLSQEQLLSRSLLVGTYGLLSPSKEPMSRPKSNKPKIETVICDMCGNEYTRIPLGQRFIIGKRRNVCRKGSCMNKASTTSVY